MKFQIDHTSPIPLHVQVEQLLRDLIKEPDYQQGKLLPKEVELAKVLGISRNTVRQATNKLSNENLLVRKKGIGTRVATSKVTTHLSDWYSFSDEMHEKGVNTINYEVNTSWENASEEVAQALEIQPGEQVLKLERVRGTEDGPTVYFVSYFHPRVGLTGEEDFTRHLYEILENDYSTIPSISKEEIKAVLADALICSKLSVKPGSPILLRTRKVLDPGSRPIEYNLGYYRAEKFTYSIDIERK
jgi:GntR family transcriptional regulator